MELNKIDAAVRQVNTAIELFFEKRDSVSVCTLVCAANQLFSDLVEHKKNGESWRTAIVASNPKLKPAEIYNILNDTPNFLKHADRDPNAIQEFKEFENEERIFMATLECGEIHPISHNMQVFQIWYMAAYPEKFQEDICCAQDAQAILPDLTNLNRKAKINGGAAFFCKMGKYRTTDKE